MLIGERLRELREQKKLSQGHIERRTGLLRCYTSRVENGHTVPSFDTLEKYARALEVPLYQLFYEGNEPPNLAKLKDALEEEGSEWGSSGKDAKILSQFRKLFGRMHERDRILLLVTARKMAPRRRTKR